MVSFPFARQNGLNKVKYRRNLFNSYKYTVIDFRTFITKMMDCINDLRDGIRMISSILGLKGNNERRIRFLSLKS